MNDLAEPTTDIKVYRTEEGWVEDNNALLCNTGHYLCLHTAAPIASLTSIAIQQAPYPAGPTADHCYRMDPFNQYIMIRSKIPQEVEIELVIWIEIHQEDDRPIFGQIDIIKRPDIPVLEKALNGVESSYCQYHLTWRTVNYLNTLLSAAGLRSEDPWLTKLARIKRATIHSIDVTTKIIRRLQNCDESWLQYVSQEFGSSPEKVSPAFLLRTIDAKRFLRKKILLYCILLSSQKFHDNNDMRHARLNNPRWKYFQECC